MIENKKLISMRINLKLKNLIDIVFIKKICILFYYLRIIYTIQYYF